MLSRTSKRMRLKLATLLTLVALALLGTTPAVARTDSGNPSILPPQSHPHGHTYGEWSATWWQWVFSLPLANHPLFTEGDVDCSYGQSGHVWFLGGVFNETGSATRTCTIPSGTSLFFPVVNLECDSITPPDLSVDELRDVCKSIMDTATDLQVEVDGRSIQDLQRYRVTSPVFQVTLPEGDILEAFGIDLPPGTYGPAVGDGIYLMLAPLPVGQHIIHFHGTIGASNFTLDITYNLTVAPRGKA